MNTSDAPCRRMICEWVEGIGYCYCFRDADTSLRDFDGMKPESPTSLEDFGFRVTVQTDLAVFSRVGDSCAKYEDGKHRPWQDRNFVGDFTVPLVKGVKRAKVAE